MDSWNGNVINLSTELYECVYGCVNLCVCVRDEEEMFGIQLYPCSKYKRD